MNSRKNALLSNKKSIILIAAALALLAVIIVVAVGVRSNSSENRLQAQLDLGCKYLEELNYEKAIAAFDAALSIDPKNEQVLTYMADAYLAWAESEDDAGNSDRALEILHEGFEKTTDSRIKDMITAIENGSVADDPDAETQDVASDEIINDENAPYRNLADDIWRLMDFQLLGKPIPAWRSDIIEDYILQNYPNPLSEYTSDDGVLFYTAKEGLNMTCSDGQVNLSVSDGADFSVGFATFESDEAYLYIYSADASLLNRYPIFGMTAREYLDSFGLGDVLDGVHGQDGKMVYFSDTDYVKITDQMMEVQRIVNRNNRWDMEVISIFYSSDASDPISNITMVFSQDTESYYN